MLFQSFITTALFAAISTGFPIETPEVDIVENDVNTTVSELDVRATFQDVYKMYTGDGSHFKAGWPNMDFWGTWDQMWNANVPLMRKSCGWNGWGKDNSETEIGYIKSSLVTVSGEVGIDKRFLLAIMMQESKGCVRVPTTPSGSGHNNPGLMQSHAGKGTCAGVANCSKAQVLLMIRDGSAGTSAGDGLKQCFAKTSAYIGSSGSQALYAAARMYNSGSVDYKNLNNGYISNKCYVVDVANRLTGWTSAASKCS
ncbi:unnamed protein product [Clonostachys rosea f. rosea IK726]|uniref:Transglycosylase SLT domain-containing protein n=2 Tax=Bionectria ochroleuca TaxID=29856 RepID=A0A0B7KD76_BIOOC|nr:unnamed protein product [Clonostachys rosea f. rosea IK726]